MIECHARFPLELPETQHGQFYWNVEPNILNKILFPAIASPKTRPTISDFIQFFDLFFRKELFQILLQLLSLLPKHGADFIPPQTAGKEFP